jgi:DUF1680 family protein
MRLTRRSFIQSAAALGSLQMLDPLEALSTQPPGSGRQPLQTLPYSQVQLTSGPFAEQYNALQKHYLALSNDSLLKVYRQRAGLPAPGADMGGWYDLSGFVPGHSLGQYISGLARMGASTGNTACHEKAHALVEGFEKTLGPKNESILRPATNLWPCYILDKHFAGLIDAAQLSGIANAKDLLSRVLQGAADVLPAQGHDRIGKKDPPYDETYVMPENLFLAADLTGNPAFQELARRYLLNRELFDPLAAGKDPFPGQHAYSHAIALSSAAQAYLHMGEPKYKQAMQHGFELLTTQQQFASGGWGPNETFITPHRGELHAALSTTVDHFETPCGAYAATKLSRYLMTFADSPRNTIYADNMERVLYNTILAVKMPDTDGDYPYYSTYSPAARKVYYQKKYPCCSGTLIQTVADYPLNLYFRGKDGLYVTQYIPSNMAWNHNGTNVYITQETNYPSEDTCSLGIQADRPVEFTLYLRIPGWLERTASIAINDRPATIDARAGTYTRLRRTWRSGDRVTLTLPQTFRTEAIDDLNPKTVALMRGPVQYVALGESPALSRNRLSLPSGLKQTGPQTFTEKYEGNEIAFTPLYMVRDQIYTSYFTRA